MGKIRQYVESGRVGESNPGSNHGLAPRPTPGVPNEISAAFSAPRGGARLKLYDVGPFIRGAHIKKKGGEERVKKKIEGKKSGANLKMPKHREVKGSSK